MVKLFASSTFVAVTDRRIITAAPKSLLRRGELGATYQLDEVRYVRPRTNYGGRVRPTIGITTERNDVQWMFPANAVHECIDDLAKEVDLAAYRVVQESLTNALKHAGPEATVDVDVLRTPAVLLIRVTDDGRGLAPDSDGEGNGILGMTERVEVLGGSVHAGPRPQGGWEVVATLPAGDHGPAGAAPEGRGDGIPSTRQASTAGGEQ